MSSDEPCPQCGHEEQHEPNDGVDVDYSSDGSFAVMCSSCGNVFEKAY